MASEVNCLTWQGMNPVGPEKKMWFQFGRGNKNNHQIPFETGLLQHAFFFSLTMGEKKIFFFSKGTKYIWETDAS